MTFNEEREYWWLQTLFEFEWDALKVSRRPPVTSLIASVRNENDLELKQLPKIIQRIYDEHNKMSASVEATESLHQSNPLVYIPGPSRNEAIKSMTTSDFSQLQTVLNQSDSVLSRKAHNPAYAQYQARLDSFKEWPASLCQQPTDLAKAGFYYFGIKDMVKCFFCNGGLKNWDHDDDAIQDHVRWFPTCQYIRQLIGHEYIEQVRLFLLLN